MDLRMVYRDVMVVVVGLGFLFVHQMSAHGTFFGTTVTAGFPSTIDGRRILSRYSWSVGILTAAVLVMGHMGIGRWIDRAIHIAGGTAFWVIAHYQARPFRRPPSTTRIVSLEIRELSLPGGWFFFLGPILILAVSTLFLDNAVARFSIWLFAALFTALLLWLAYLVHFRTRQVSVDGLPIRRERDFKRSSFVGFMLFAYVASLAPAFLKAAFWLEFTHGNRSVAYVTSIVAILGIPVVTGLRFIARWPKGEPQECIDADMPTGDGTPDECWKLGLIYYNPADPAFIVTRRMGWGWELNWANKWSWLFAVAAVVGPIAMAFFARWIKGA